MKAVYRVTKAAGTKKESYLDENGNFTKFSSDAKTFKTRTEAEQAITGSDQVVQQTY